MDEKKDRFLNWLLTPKHQRQPSTQDELARELDVSTSTLVRWKQDPEFIREQQKRLRELGGAPEQIREVVDAMRKAARDGDSKAAQLYLKWADALTPQEEPEEVPPDLRHLSDEELLRRTEALSARLKGEGPEGPLESVSAVSA